MARKRSTSQVRLVTEDTDMTCEEMAIEYLQVKERQGLSPYSIRHEESNIRTILKKLPLGMKLSTLNPNLLENVFDQFRAVGQHPNTINDKRKTLIRMLDLAVKQDYLRTNPALGVLKMKGVVPAIPSLSQLQIRALLLAPKVETFAGYRDKVLIELMLDTGIRLREALELVVSQIDFKDRRLRAVKGKNGKLEDIPLSLPLCKELSNYLKERDHTVAEQVFVNVDGGPLNRRTFQIRLKEYGQKAGIQDVRVSPHTLRHTFAKQWILNGGDIFSLQRILRHSTMDMVRRYVFLWGTEIQQQHDKYSPMARVFGNRGGLRA